MTADNVFAALALLRLADETEDRREILDEILEPVVEQVLDSDDPGVLVSAAQMLGHVAGWGLIGDWFVERLMASPPHARGQVLDAFDELAHQLINRPRPVRWA